MSFALTEQYRIYGAWGYHLINTFPISRASQILRPFKVFPTGEKCNQRAQLTKNYAEVTIGVNHR